jgi:hypothetical protein
MASTNPHAVLKNEQPKTGYKMVVTASGSYGIATLSIPPKSTVVKTSYRVYYRGQPELEKMQDVPLLRTDRALVVSISPLNTPTKIEATGSSLRRATHKYHIGKFADAILGPDPVADGCGIHFFENVKHAKMWIALLS